MLLNFTWLIPGIPIISSIFIAVLLLSFSKTMNRLTKPVSYLLIISVALSEIINFVLWEEKASGIAFISQKIEFLRNNFELFVDSQALLASLVLGFVVLLIMMISFIRLKRRDGYVRYFIFLGFLSGLAYLFAFSGSTFHNFFDPLVAILEKV